MPEPVLVVGATRILRPAVAELIGTGRGVVAVARSATDLAALSAELGQGVIGVAADHRYPEVLHRRLLAAGARCSAALVYAPTSAEVTAEVVSLVTDGPVVELLVSAAAAPAGVPEADFDLASLPSRPGSRWHRLVLGWTRDGRWHTPEQISAAALGVLRSEMDAVLGVVRPWSSRPS